VALVRQLRQTFTFLIQNLVALNILAEARAANFAKWYFHLLAVHPNQQAKNG